MTMTTTSAPPSSAGVYICYCADIRTRTLGSKGHGDAWAFIKPLDCSTRKTWAIEPPGRLWDWSDAGCQSCALLAEAIHRTARDMHVPLDCRKIRLSFCDAVPQLKVTLTMGHGENSFYLAHPEGIRGQILEPPSAH